MEPISFGTGSTSVVMYLRKGKNTMQQLWERSEDLWNNYVVNNNSEEGSRGGDTCAGGDSPAACGEEQGNAGWYFAACGGQQCSSPWRTPRQSMDTCFLKEVAAYEDPVLEQAPGRSCARWRGALAGAGFLVGAVACGEIFQEQSTPEGLTPWKGSMLKQFMKYCFPREGLHTRAGEEHVERTSNRSDILWTDHNLHLLSTSTTYGEKIGVMNAVMSSAWQEGGVEKKWF